MSSSMINPDFVIGKSAALVSLLKLSILANQLISNGEAHVECVDGQLMVFEGPSTDGKPPSLLKAPALKDDSLAEFFCRG